MKYLESGDNVTLDRVALGLRDVDSPKVASERVEGHSSANDGGVVTHCPSRQFLFFSIEQRDDLLARADIEAIQAMTWRRQFLTSGGSNVPDA